MSSGVDTAESNAVYPPATFSMSSAPPTSSAPAAIAASAAGPAANHLIGFPRVTPELQRALDGRVTLCRTGLFCERDRVGRSVKLACLDLLGGGAICLRFCSHCVLSLRLIRP